MLTPLHNLSLADYSTLRLGGPARYFLDVTSATQLAEAIEWARLNKLAWQVIGGGSNIVFADEGFDGLIIRNKIKGIEIKEQGSATLLQAGAGESWDGVVQLSCEKGLYGLAELSLIPGTVGATPVQNIGAYGREISETLSHVEAYDSHTKTWKTLTAAQCKFSYRTSIFNSTEKHRYAIASVTYKLSHEPREAPLYASLAQYLEKYNVTARDPFTIRSAVIAVRQIRLPDPTRLPNLGSFFKNPIVDTMTASRIAKKHPDMPKYPAAHGSIKLAAGWLIEKANLKGYAAHGLYTYKENALVIVNDTAQSARDLFAFRDEIIARVQQQFGITLTQEPEIVGKQKNAPKDPSS